MEICLGIVYHSWERSHKDRDLQSFPFNYLIFDNDVDNELSFVKIIVSFMNWPGACLSLCMQSFMPRLTGEILQFVELLQICPGCAGSPPS